MLKNNKRFTGIRVVRINDIKKEEFSFLFLILAGDIIAFIGIKGIRYFSNGVPFNFVKRYLSKLQH